MSVVESFETELEFAGEMRPCTVSYVLDDGVYVSKVVMWRAESLHYNWLGEFRKQDVRYEVNVINLLSPAQIKGLVAEITAELQEAA